MISLIKLIAPSTLDRVMPDLLKSIAVITALSGPEFAHARSIITHDFTSSEEGKYKPMDMRTLLENEQTLMDADKRDTGVTILVTRIAKNTKELLCTLCGGMAGRTIEESIAMRKVERNATSKEKGKATTSNITEKRSKITITNKDGHTLHLEGDSLFLAEYLNTQTGSKPEFAGLVSDTIPTLETLEAKGALEYNSYIALNNDNDP
ncbi:hypothetical protein C0993_005297 [Termitomyces sp. T159_Od127]|nr:hypothetical protein C0993_005297 [Termitomyces sp. T159_Od127]